MLLGKSTNPCWRELRKTFRDRTFRLKHTYWQRDRNKKTFFMTFPFLYHPPTTVSPFLLEYNKKTPCHQTSNIPFSPCYLVKTKKTTQSSIKGPLCKQEELSTRLPHWLAQEEALSSTSRIFVGTAAFVFSFSLLLLTDENFANEWILLSRSWIVCNSVICRRPIRTPVCNIKKITLNKFCLFLRKSIQYCPKIPPIMLEPAYLARAFFQGTDFIQQCVPKNMLQQSTEYFFSFFL